MRRPARRRYWLLTSISVLVLAAALFGRSYTYVHVSGNGTADLTVETWGLFSAQSTVVVDEVPRPEQPAAGSFGVRASDWSENDDPAPGPNADWIRPATVKRDAAGRPLYDQSEPLPPAE